MKRIVVYGPSGSGKTTTARLIGERLGIPHIELDALMHVNPEWKDATPEEFRDNIRAALAAAPDGWVSDGNYYSAVGDLLITEADTAVWLRLPWLVVYPRLVKRTLRRVVSREVLWGTNTERWRDLFSKESMLIWGIKAWRPHYRKTRDRLRARPEGVRLVVLKSPGEVARFLESIGE